MAIKTKKTKSTKSTAVQTPEISTPATNVESKDRSALKSFVTKLLLVITVGTLLFLGIQKYRGLIIAGMVNTNVITRMELNERLMDRYGQATLDEIISEKILSATAEKEGVKITDEEIAAEITANETQFGGPEALKEAAKSYGLKNDSEIREFFSYRLMVNKLQAKLFTVDVTDEEIKTYFDSNKEFLGDSKLEDVKEDIRNQLKSQKIQTEFSTWFQGVKETAKIQLFI